MEYLEFSVTLQKPNETSSAMWSSSRSFIKSANSTIIGCKPCIIIAQKCFHDCLISRTCIREIILSTNTHSIYYWSSEDFRGKFHNKIDNPLRNLYFVRFKEIWFLQKCQYNLCASQWSRIHKKNKKDKKSHILYHIGCKVRFQEVISFISRNEWYFATMIYPIIHSEKKLYLNEWILQATVSFSS